MGEITKSVSDILDGIKMGVETIEKYKDIAARFAKLAGVFGVLGGALGFASSLFGGDPVMDKLEKIHESIGNLQVSMNAGFDRLSNEIESQSCIQSLSHHVNEIDTTATALKASGIENAS